MKRSTYLLTFLLCSFILYSCQKCKDCRCTQIVVKTGKPNIEQTFELKGVCGDYLKEMEGYGTLHETVDGITQTIEQVCDCYIR
jgi:hypothetical protein